MRKYRVLCFTDHAGHTSENSIYAILSAMACHSKCEEIVVASRSNNNNNSFFYDHNFEKLHVARVDNYFNYESSRKDLFETDTAINPSDYDIIFLRLPFPTSDEFFKDLEAAYNSKCIINKPSGIIQCRNKAVLLNFQDVCPPIKLCHSIEDILSFGDEYDIVLKPLRGYGGKGLIRVMGGVLNDGNKDHSTLEYLQKIENQISSDGYLAMKYLKNVVQGDKRLIVVDGEILAASLRIPSKDSWLCNVAMGGSSERSDPDERELDIVKQINPYLLKHGILMYGADTLVDDDGTRILSEINALSIGGFPQVEKQTGKPIIKLALDKFFAYADVHFSN